MRVIAMCFSMDGYKWLFPAHRMDMSGLELPSVLSQTPKTRKLFYNEKHLSGRVWKNTGKTLN